MFMFCRRFSKECSLRWSSNSTFLLHPIRKVFYAMQKFIDFVTKQFNFTFTGKENTLHKEPVFIPNRRLIYFLLVSSDGHNPHTKKFFWLMVNFFKVEKLG
jgi:hypothetical protein